MLQQVPADATETLVYLHDPDLPRRDFSENPPRIRCGALMLAGSSLEETFVAAVFYHPADMKHGRIIKSRTWDILRERMKSGWVNTTSLPPVGRRPKSIVLDISNEKEDENRRQEIHAFFLGNSGMERYRTSVDKLLDRAAAYVEGGYTHPMGKLPGDPQNLVRTPVFWVRKKFQGMTFDEALVKDDVRRVDYINSRILTALKAHRKKFQTTAE